MSVTIIILVLTVGISLLALNDRKYFHRFEYNPFLVKHQKQYYRLISHAVIHADYMHLAVNMYVLYGFGEIAEGAYSQIFGSFGILLYISMYIGGILFSSLPAYKKHQNNSYYNAVGASGAVSAVLFSSILFMPTAGMGILFIPIRIPAFLFGALYLLFEAYMNKKNMDNVAHDAHIWGAIFGIVFTIILEPKIALYFIQEVAAYLY